LFWLALVVGACGGGSDGGEGDFRARFAVVGGQVPATQEALRERAQELDIDAEVRIDGDEIEIAVPGGDEAAAEADIAQLTRPGELRFYDWEANVVGERGRPAPGDESVTGGAAAGDPLVGAALTRAEARERASEGTVVVRAESPDVGPPADAWYVLRDRPALTGEDILEPEQGFDNSPSGTGEPVVTFDFTPRGRAAFRELTLEVARRGSSLRPPGADARDAAHHFAIVLDDEILTVPFVDFTTSPDGIDPQHGSVIQGGFTIESAQELASILKLGPLPARLERR
jgi:SecD/SecF fusion protein